VGQAAQAACPRFTSVESASPAFVQLSIDDGVSQSQTSAGKPMREIFSQALRSNAPRVRRDRSSSSRDSRRQARQIPSWPRSAP